MTHDRAHNLCIINTVRFCCGGFVQSHSHDGWRRRRNPHKWPQLCASRQHHRLVSITIMRPNVCAAFAQQCGLPSKYGRNRRGMCAISIAKAAASLGCKYKLVYGVQNPNCVTLRWTAYPGGGPCENNARADTFAYWSVRLFFATVSGVLARRTLITTP